LLATAAAAQPAASACSDNGADHERWAIKNQPGPGTVNVANESDIDVNEMLTWRVPVGIPKEQKRSGKPITKRERQHQLLRPDGLRARDQAAA
jgi:hypothetical protein